MSTRTARMGAIGVLALSLSGCVSTGGDLSATHSPGSVATPAAIPSSVAFESATPAGTSASSTPVPSVPALGTTDNGAGSIVYIKDGNVWIAAPDGSGATQLTTDGSPGESTTYHDPSEAPDGTVYALHGPAELVALDRSGGSQKLAPVTLPVLENGAESLAVAPDGAHITYTTTGYGQTIDPRFGTPNGAFIYGGTDVATPNGTSVPNAAMAGAIFPAWADGSNLVVGDGVKLYTASIGSQPQTWVDLSNGCLTEIGCPAGQSPAANVGHPTVSRDGALVAFSLSPDFGAAGGRVIASLDGPPPAQPTVKCVMPDQESFSDPGSFAPDHSAFAYDDTTFDPDTLDSTVGQGIWVARLDLSASDCGASGAKLVIPGGAQPEWGPLAP